MEEVAVQLENRRMDQVSTDRDGEEQAFWVEGAAWSTAHEGKQPATSRAGQKAGENV